jgi:hypothetical protein
LSALTNSRTLTDGPEVNRARPRVTDGDVAIIGAGPYGLSATAFLKSKGVDVHVFGEPMGFWRNKMPAGMLLRSPRVASNIADPQSALTLEGYERDAGLAPKGPLPLETFVNYGEWFKEKLGTSLQPAAVATVSRQNSMFRLTLQNGTTLSCQRVVVAAGIAPFQRIPAVFADLPSTQVSHCYQGKSISDFRGKRVAVIGAGQSALESAALLNEAGARVEVIAAIPQLRWIGMHGWLHKLGPISSLLYSKHEVGPLGISRLVAAPMLVHQIPLNVRDKIRIRAVRPAGAKWLPDRLAHVMLTVGRTVRAAKSTGTEVQLFLDDGSERWIDHVLLGTGYDVDIDRYDFLDPDLRRAIRRLGGYPDLRRGFRSSVPGLHFIGATAARSFGPLLYFVAGTEFASRGLTAHIAGSRSRVCL